MDFQITVDYLYGLREKNKEFKRLQYIKIEYI